MDIVTVSMNRPDDKSVVVSFLKKERAISQNFIVNSTDSADAVSAFGTNWTGGVPYIVLIGKNGQVLYKNQGGTDALTIRRAILKNLPDDLYRGQHAYWNSTF